MSTNGLDILAIPYLSLVERELDGPADDSALDAIFGRLDEELRSFEHKALLHSGSQTAVEMASYLLCSFSDEMLIKHRGITWSRHSLLVHHHADAFGGEKCWITLEELIHASPRDRKPWWFELLRLYEQVISLGLRGRYHLLSDGEQMVYQWRLRLHELLHADDLRELQSRQLVKLATEHLKVRETHWFTLIALLAVIGVVSSILLVDVSLSRQWREVSANLTESLRAADTVQVPETSLTQPAGKKL